MAQRDDMRMNRQRIELVGLDQSADAKMFWKNKTVAERMEALELTRQVLNGYDPATTRFQRVLAVVAGPGS